MSANKIFQTTKSSTDRNDSSLYIPQSPSANAELSTTLNSTLVSLPQGVASDWSDCSKPLCDWEKVESVFFILGQNDRVRETENSRVK